MARTIRKQRTLQRLGHSTKTITQDIYAHVLPRHQEAALAEVSGMLKIEPEIRIVES